MLNMFMSSMENGGMCKVSGLWSIRQGQSGVWFEMMQ